MTSTIFVVVSFLWLGSEIVLARTRRSRATDPKLDRFSICILWITILMSVTLGIVVSALHPGDREQTTGLLSATGLALIVCGLIVRWFAILSLRHQFTVDVSIRKDHRIIREGIYRYIRHPSYAGSLLSFLGLGVSLLNYLSVLIIVVPISLAFLHRIRVEEEALEHAFGKEYLDYCASTRRLIPGIF